MKNFKILFLRGFWGVTQSDEYVLMPNQGGLIIWRVKHKTGAHDEAPFQTGFKCKKKVPKIKTRQMINPHWKWKLWGEKLQKIVQKSALKPWKKKHKKKQKKGKITKKNCLHSRPWSLSLLAFHIEKFVFEKYQHFALDLGGRKATGWSEQMQPACHPVAGQGSSKPMWLTDAPPF